MNTIRKTIGLMLICTASMGTTLPMMHSTLAVRQLAQRATPNLLNKTATSQAPRLFSTRTQHALIKSPRAKSHTNSSHTTSTKDTRMRYIPFDLLIIGGTILGWKSLNTIKELREEKIRAEAEVEKIRAEAEVKRK